MDTNNPITYFGETDARNKKIKFGIKAKDRLKHMYVIGKTGMGKSTLLENMAIQDIQNGEGLAVIDPHGSMAEKLLEYVPEHRVKDVLYFAPFDLEHPIAFNVMEDVAPDKRHLVVNGLMATFEKIWADAWSARMSYILQYSIIGLLEYPDSTLLGINKMLSDKDYRKKVVDNITDASAKSFWIDEFGKYTERFAAEATPAIQNKVGQFTSNSLVRNIIGQPKSSFDIREMMDTKKILIINLSKGQVGELNAKLIGSMLITKIYLAAMSRADKAAEELNKLPNFYLYVDEFQSFANKSFADILSEARKYKLNLTIAHQYVEQMEEEVRNAVFGNVGTMIIFRVGAFDAELLEKEFAPTFTAEDLVNLGFAQIYLKLMIDGVSSHPFSATTLAPIAKPDITFKEQVVESSRKQFGRSRKDVEETITLFYEDGRRLQSAPNTNKSGGTSNPGGAPNTQSQQPVAQSENQVKNPPVTLRAPLPPEKDLPVPAKEHVDQNKMAFAQAAEALRRTEEQNREDRIKNKEFENQKPIIKSQENKFSLSDLKPAHEKAKIPTKENVSSLQQALASVLQKPTEQKMESRSQNLEKKEEKRIENPTPHSSFQHQTSTPKEIPEDVLRKLLKVEEPKSSL